MDQWVRVVVCKHKDLSSNPWHTRKWPCTATFPHEPYLSITLYPASRRYSCIVLQLSTVSAEDTGLYLHSLGSPHLPSVFAMQSAQVWILRNWGWDASMTCSAATLLRGKSMHRICLKFYIVKYIYSWCVLTWKSVFKITNFMTDNLLHFE